MNELAENLLVIFASNIVLQHLSAFVWPRVIMYSKFRAETAEHRRRAETAAADRASAIERESGAALARAHDDDAAAAAAVATAAGAAARTAAAEAGVAAAAASGSRGDNSAAPTERGDVVEYDDDDRHHDHKHEHGWMSALEMQYIMSPNDPDIDAALLYSSVVIQARRHHRQGNSRGLRV
jgi:hypothetical protein